MTIISVSNPVIEQILEETEIIEGHLHERQVILGKGVDNYLAEDTLTAFQFTAHMYSATEPDEVP